MTLLKSGVLIIGKSLLAIVSLVILGYVLLLIVNWQDAKPNPDSLHMQSLLQQNAIPDAQNGYPYFMANLANKELHWSESLQTLKIQCSRQENCEELLAAQTNLPSLISEHHQLQALYRQLIQFRYWQEPIPTHFFEGIPKYETVLNGQQLLFWQAWLDAKHGNALQVEHALQQDYLFWKNVLANNNSLLAKMISTAALKQHFDFAPTIITELPVTQRQAFAIKIWAEEFNEKELSLEQAMAGEWHLAATIMHSIKQGDYPSYASDNISLLERVLSPLIRPLILLEDTKNFYASQLRQVSEHGEQASRPWYHWLRNPLGKLTTTGSAELYHTYQQQLQQLEKIRLDAMSRAG